MGYLDTAGLTYFWNKIKGRFLTTAERKLCPKVFVGTASFGRADSSTNVIFVRTQVLEAELPVSNLKAGDQLLLTGNFVNTYSNPVFELMTAIENNSSVSLYDTVAKGSKASIKYKGSVITTSNTFYAGTGVPTLYIYDGTYWNYVGRSFDDYLEIS